jgi:hypothetical protein
MKKFGGAEKVDWCSVINSTGSSLKNVFAKKIIQELTKLLPRKLFECPLNGIIDIIDVSTNFELMKMMPKGVYSLRVEAMDKKQPIAVNGSVTIQQV